MANLADDLITLVRDGRKLCDQNQARVAHLLFVNWLNKVSGKIRTECSSELALEWEILPSSPLQKAGVEQGDPVSWAKFNAAVNARCEWLARLPSRIKAVVPERVQSSALAAGRKEVQFGAKSRAFVDPSRINELKQIGKDKFDFSKLVRMCEEINICFAADCYLAVAMLTRAIVDHVPPIFNANSFAEIANNYSGQKSFKESMQALENSSRKIADQHLHCKIRDAEVLPNATQVDFSQPLDVLLGEIVRLHKRG